MLARLPNRAWLVVGDFNCVRRSNEKASGRNLPNTMIDVFNNVLNFTRLVELT